MLILNYLQSHFKAEIKNAINCTNAIINEEKCLERLHYNKIYYITIFNCLILTILFTLSFYIKDKYLLYI